MGTGLQFGILGPLEVWASGTPVHVGGPRQRALLGLLLCRANRVVSRDELIEELLGDQPADSAGRQLQVQISRLRQALAGDGGPRVLARPPGYLLRVEPGELDLEVFEQRVAAGRAALSHGDPGRAAALLGSAESLWRGRPLADLEFEPFARFEIQRLAELRLLAAEDRIEAQLALGQHGALCPELGLLVAEHPLRERLRGQLMLALYRCGRQAEALETYRAGRSLLVAELGIEPGPALRRVHEQVLAADPLLDLPAPAGAAAAGDVLAAVDGRPLGALAAARLAPTNLPAQLSAFIGRDLELSEVRALVASCRLVTLIGAGGCGKTRLGLQLAAGLLEGPGDGVWLVELAAVTSEDAVAPAICQALGIAAQPGRPALEVLLDALAPQDLLLVLDNCEHLIGGCAATAEAIVRRCPRVRLVATSREPLSIGGEAIYRVPPLSLPGPGDRSLLAAESSDAVALLADRARAQGTGLVIDERTAPLVVSICVRLDGLPLAIELAAVRLRSLSLRELNDRLHQRFRLLTGGDRTAPQRQQTLQAAVAWSYALLTRAEQLLLGRLSVFARSFDLAAAEAVGGFGDIDAPDVADLLGSLVDKSLVVAEPAGPALRYRLLETIRQFAADRLAESGGDEATAAAAHCAHYLSVAETAAPRLTGPEQGSWLTGLDADQANLRRAAEHAASRPDGTAQVLRFGIALRRYWEARTGDDETALLVRVLRRPEATADPALFAEALVAAADLTVILGRSTGLQLAQQADQVARALGDNRLLVLTCGALCWAYGAAAEWERAWALGKESVERARELGDDVLLVKSLAVYAAVVRADESSALFAEALACTERTGDLYHLIIIRVNVGGVALTMGDIPAARAHLEAAIRAAEAIGVPHLIALANLAEVRRAEHDLDGARSGFEDVVRVGRRTGDKAALADALRGLACLAADLGDWHQAAMLYGAEHALMDQVGAQWDPFGARRRQESLDQATAALGEKQLQQAYARGKALSFDQAIDLALGGNLPGT